MTTSDSQNKKAKTISLADEESVKKVLVNSVLGLWDVVNELTRLKPSRRERYRVTIFGSARATPGSFGYEETKRAAAALADMGCDIVTGGGPGLMQAANEGAKGSKTGAESVGIRVDLPFEQGLRPGLIDWARSSMLADPPLASASDLGIPRCVTNADEAIAVIREHHALWQLNQSKSA